MQEMRVRSLGREDPLEKEMTTHSSIFPWKNPIDRAWWATKGHKELDVTQQLNNSTLALASIFSLVKLGSHYLPHGGAVVIKCGMAGESTPLSGIY